MTQTHKLSYDQLVAFFKENNAHLGHAIISDNRELQKINQEELNIMHFAGDLLDKPYQGICNLFKSTGRDGIILIDNRLNFDNEKYEQISSLEFDVRILEFDR